jgi:Fur family ferric uptake transcriptional regulator
MTETAHPNPDYEAALREAGVRITRPRRIILGILSEAGDHPDAMEIFRRAVEIARALGYEIVHHRLELYGRRRRRK